MKKRKELLWFLIPFVLLAVGSIWVTVAELTEIPQYIMGGEQYVKLLLADPLFWVAVGNTLLGYWLMGVFLGGAVSVVALLLHLWVPLSRRWGYVAVFTVSTLIALGIWIAQMGLSRLGYVCVYAVQIGNAAAFFAWLAECVWTAVKKPKQECETL